MFFLSCVCYAFVRVYLYVRSVYMCLVVTCWERADLLALVCGVILYVFHFPIGILGQVWYLIVLIPDILFWQYLYSFLAVVYRGPHGRLAFFC